mmetsp:Transcript_13573/g.29735  ORF Transcript_13573/g.29735 Transcript_13573/m.29735 type:complete len:146 (-) Transcript_13573:1270-1707(-)
MVSLWRGDVGLEGKEIELGNCEGSGEVTWSSVRGVSCPDGAREECCGVSAKCTNARGDCGDADAAPAKRLRTVLPLRRGEASAERGEMGERADTGALGVLGVLGGVAGPSPSGLVGEAAAGGSETSSLSEFLITGSDTVVVIARC